MWTNKTAEETAKAVLTFFPTMTYVASQTKQNAMAPGPCLYSKSLARVSSMAHPKGKALSCLGIRT